MPMEGRIQRAVARASGAGTGDGSREDARGCDQGRDPGPTGETGDGLGRREAEPGSTAEDPFDNPMRGSPDSGDRTLAETRRRRGHQKDRTQSGVGSDDAERQRTRPPSGGRDRRQRRGIGAGTVPEDPTKTMVVASPDARNHRAQRDGTYLEGQHRPSSHPAGWSRGTPERVAVREAEEVESRAIGRGDMPMSSPDPESCRSQAPRDRPRGRGVESTARRPRRSREKVMRGGTRARRGRGTCTTAPAPRDAQRKPLQGIHTVDPTPEPPQCFGTAGVLPFGRSGALGRAGPRGAACRSAPPGAPPGAGAAWLRARRAAGAGCCSGRRRHPGAAGRPHPAGRGPP